VVACERETEARRATHRRHRPERTALYAIVREHLAAFERLAEENYARPLPKYVRRAFAEYLRCGLPEHGVMRLHCEDCGHDRVVAFSCKQRGPCPSCAGRIMANTAAHLVDRVLPNVPIRQWVLSLPHELRMVAARHPAVISAIDRILFREVERWMRRSAGPREGRAGAVTFVQRFGGSLNLHVHFHVLFLEGLFTRDGDALVSFHPVLTPTREELLDVLRRVARATRRMLSRRACADENPDGLEPSAMDGCARMATQRGLFDHLHELKRGQRDEDPFDAPQGRHSIAHDGFNLHAAVQVGADDDVSRERLVRYCARPAFAHERISILSDGRIAYAIKQPRKSGTHRILEPVELIARIAALIPPPRCPFLRYHGVLAPNSRWRSLIVPRSATPPTHPRPSSSPPTPKPKSHQRQQPARAAFAMISAAHQTRLAAGELLATGPRLDWSRLLRRTFACDVLICPRCKGRARVLAVIQDPSEARRLAESIGEGTDPPATRAGHNDSDLLDRAAADDDAPDIPPDSEPPQLTPDD
jgi:hypothetical protein